MALLLFRESTGWEKACCVLECRRVTCTDVYSGSGPLVQWPGSGYYPSGAREDCQGSLEGEVHSSLYNRK